MIDELTPDEMRKLVLSSNESTRARFVEVFQPGIDNFSILMAKAFRQLQAMEGRVPHELRSAWTYQYLYAAFNCLFTSFHLLTSGFLIPAGNLMRQFGEAIAMALLCSHRGIDVFDRLQRDRERFPVKDAVDLVNRRKNCDLLGIHEERWKQFREITKFYNEFSHSSFVAVASTQIFATGGRQLGGEYDPEKFDFYNKEVSLSITGAMQLLDAIARTERNLNESRAPG